jgi:hypothetical protein
MKFGFSVESFKKFLSTNFLENPSSMYRVFPTGRTDMMQLIVLSLEVCELA